MMTEEQSYLFDLCGYLHLSNTLTPEDPDAASQAAGRYIDYPLPRQHLIAVLTEPRRSGAICKESGYRPNPRRLAHPEPHPRWRGFSPPNLSIKRALS